MASNLGWLQRAQTRPATFTALRTGQWPKHPRPIKEEKPGKDPAFMDDGGPQAGYTPSQTDTPWWQNPAWQAQNDHVSLPPIDPSQVPEGWQSENGLQGVWKGSNQPLDDRPEWMTNPSLKPEQAEASAQAAGPEPTDPTANIDKRNEGIDPLSIPQGIPGAAERQADLRDTLRQYPVDKQPAWWQRVLGGIAGGAAGVSNAAGHTRQPIDIAAMRQNILHPGYQDKLNEWNSEYSPMAAQVNMDAAQRTAQLAAQKEQSTAALQSAEAQRALEQGKYWAGQGKTNMVTVTPAISAATKGLFPVGHQISSADMKEIIHDVLSTPTPAKIQTLKILNQAFAEATGQPVGSDVPTAVYEAALKAQNPADRNVTDAQLAYLAAQGDKQAKAALDLRVQQHNQERTPPNPEVMALREEAAQDRRVNSNQSTDNQKIAAEGQAFSRYQQQINSPNATPEQKAQAQGQYVSALQGIQDTYARTVRARGGSAQDLKVVATPNGVQYVPRTTAPVAPPRAGISPPPSVDHPPVSEQTIRAGAIANGKDPNAAVAKAKKLGMIP